MSERRRIEDTPLGKVIYLWPLIAGTCACLISLGGILWGIHNNNDSITKIQEWITQHNDILSRQVALTETMDKRISILEKIMIEERQEHISYESRRPQRSDEPDESDDRNVPPPKTAHKRRLVPGLPFFTDDPD